MAVYDALAIEIRPETHLGGLDDGLTRSQTREIRHHFDSSGKLNLGFSVIDKVSRARQIGTQALIRPQPGRPLVRRDTHIKKSWADDGREHRRCHSTAVVADGGVGLVDRYHRHYRGSPSRGKADKTGHVLTSDIPTPR